MRFWRGPRLDERGRVMPVRFWDVIRDVAVSAVVAVLITGGAWLLARAIAPYFIQ